MNNKKNNKNGSCCSGSSSCCNSVQEMSIKKKSLTIDFLYLDLSVCVPCQGTESVLEEAINDVKSILELTGIEVNVNKINVLNEELAIKYRFISSPTIRINGRDIQLEVKESSCQTCSDLSGVITDCRIWVYQGNEYNVPPKAMIIESILKAVYGNFDVDSASEKTHIIPENLKQFYSAMKKQTD